MKHIKYLGLGIAMLFMACDDKIRKENDQEVTSHIEEVAVEYAPDSRVALFEIEAQKKNNQYILKGESNLPGAVDALKEKLRAEKISFVDSISLLPDHKGLEEKIKAVVTISVANLREEPRHASQLVTQATLGMPLNVYKKQDNWYYVQTPDGYLAWVDSGGLENMTDEEFSKWKRTEKLIFLEAFGASYKKPSNDGAVVADLVAGDILELTGEKAEFYEVEYPNEKKAFVKKSQSAPYKEWLNSMEINKENLVKTSEALMGLPYLWGGTSPKGVDCSGFTKTVYFMNGMILPRDASQQVHSGKLVDTIKKFENLIAGDLLFFGRPATDSTSERVVHVGMWIGEDKFIHSMGEVRISTFDSSSSEFDRYNYDRYLRTKRLLDQPDERIIYLKDSDIFMEEIDSTSSNR